MALNGETVKGRLDATHITLGLGILYLFGFIVANVHFGRYGLPRIELLRARYLAAALLFILCSAIPFANGAFLSRVLRTRAPGDGPIEKEPKLGESEAWAMGAASFFGSLLGAVGFELLIISRLAVSPLPVLGVGALYFMMATMVSWQICDTLMGGESSVSGQAWPSANAIPRRRSQPLGHHPPDPV